MRRDILTVSIVAVLVASGAAAQAPPAVPPGASAAAIPSPAPAVPPTQAAPKRECTRLPLSDIQFGRAETIATARQKLVEEYAPKHLKARGWKTYSVSNETASCEDYLFIPLLGQEYKCLVTLTFCKTS